ncbi:hypothetical protein QBC38DRAFT_180052 [Podospora fimiseda]|uniref:Uncharacterized protein n=1 Tax=Podospora fimiseda TaxID=252190 RepID=A0AAN7BYP6_9PEZI|nr:hypothetical protein QBC38DRAFT_180052 [Podospora fimiseda]
MAESRKREEERRKQELLSIPPGTPITIKPRVTTLTPTQVPGGRKRPKIIYITHYEEDVFRPSGRKDLPPPLYSTVHPSKQTPDNPGISSHVLADVLEHPRAASPANPRAATPGPPPSTNVKPDVYEDYDSTQFPFRSSSPVLPMFSSALSSEPYKSSPVLSSTGKPIKGILKTPEQNSSAVKKTKKRVTIDPVLDYNSPPKYK